MNGLVAQVGAAAESSGAAVWALALGVALALVALLGSALLMVVRRLQKLADEQRFKLEARLQDGARSMARTREELELAIRDQRAQSHNLHILVSSLLDRCVTRKEFIRMDDECEELRELVQEEQRTVDGVKAAVARLVARTEKP